MNEDYMFEDEDNIEQGSYKAPQFQYQEQPQPQPEVNQRMGLAVFSFVFGVLSLIFFLSGINLIGALISIILGIIFIATRRQKRGKVFAITGIIASVFSIVMCLFSWAFIFNNADNIAVLADDKEGMEFFYDYYGIEENQEEYNIFEEPKGDDMKNLFDGNIDEGEHPEVDYGDTL